MVDSSWGVVIVLYHPDETHLSETVKGLVELTDQVALVNNGERLSDDFEYPEFVTDLGSNRGIAFAQNRGVESLIARDPTLEQVFFLDQDSDLPEGYFQGMLDTWSRVKHTTPNLGILSPRIERMNKPGSYSVLYVDQHRLNKMKFEDDRRTTVKGTLPISSGILVSVSAFNAVGGLSEKWFIDWVDYDFDLEVLRAGYMNVTTAENAIIHKIGAPQRRHFFGREFEVTNYVLFREYYMTRNGIYLMRKFGRTIKGLRRYCFGGIARRFLMVFYEPHKLKRTGVLIKGLVAGLFTSYR
ncbi:hypothetical protein [Lacticaseibacillus sp. 53-4]|uniref:hypothetical protein n=1 Tax=Lacticaseibacillus sp. 53-4 TaxID=2799575 RepID=UPI001945AA61|nr:hypothetical protein [Lacticaseibacillus sp. 53-4]